MGESNIISRREYLDLCVKMASSAFANPYGEEGANVGNISRNQSSK